MELSEWISVDDRLPQEGEVVLVYYGYYLIKFDRRLYAYGIGRLYKGDWSGLHGQFPVCIAWMPLPEPPENEGMEDDDYAID